MSSDFEGKLVAELAPPERERVEWFLARLRPGAGFELGELEAGFAERFRPVDRLQKAFARRVERMGMAVARDVTREISGRIVIELIDGKGRSWLLRLRIANQPPHAIEMFALARPLPPGAVMREATLADAWEIEAIEAGSGIEREDGSVVTTILGAGLFELSRLKDQGRVWIVEVDAAPAACDAGCVRPVSRAGGTARLFHRHHTRVLPQFRRLGLNEYMVSFLAELDQTDLHTDATSVYIDPNNTVIKEWSGIPPWKARPLRALLSCSALAGEPYGRRASPGDSEFSAHCINALHDGEALFIPYDSQSFSDRLGRTTSYGFGDVWRSERAVLGMWNGSERVILDRAGATTELRRSFVLDYGCQLGGGLLELERLLRAACGRAQSIGVSHLSIFFRRGSDVEPLVRSLSMQVVEVEFQSWLREPDDSAQRGVYVDHVYF